MNQPIHATVTLENLVLETTVSRVGRDLQMQLLDFDLVSTNLYEWEPEDHSTSLPHPLQIDGDNGIKYKRLNFLIPQILLLEGREIPASLNLVIAKNDWSMALVFENQNISRKVTVGDFEDDYRLLENQHGSALPLKNCFGCAFSDYSEYGRDFMGDMGCFRDTKTEYLQYQGKLGAFWENKVEWVTEIHSCNEFEPRNPNIRVGYRG